MGYYAKDHSYVRDESDDKVSAHISQGDAWEAEKRIMDQLDREEKRKKAALEAEREFRANVLAEQRAHEQRKAEEYQRSLDKIRQRENWDRYGVPYDLRNPRDLEERKNRALFWSRNNKWDHLKAVVSGKDKEFSRLVARYHNVQTEEERLAVVEAMEKIYPTSFKAIRKIEKQRRK